MRVREVDRHVFDSGFRVFFKVEPVDEFGRRGEEQLAVHRVVDVVLLDVPVELDFRDFGREEDGCRQNPGEHTERQVVRDDRHEYRDEHDDRV